MRRALLAFAALAVLAGCARVAPARAVPSKEYAVTLCASRGRIFEGGEGRWKVLRYMADDGSWQEICTEKKKLITWAKANGFALKLAEARGYADGFRHGHSRGLSGRKICESKNDAFESRFVARMFLDLSGRDEHETYDKAWRKGAEAGWKQGEAERRSRAKKTPAPEVKP